MLDNGYHQVIQSLLSPYILCENRSDCADSSEDSWDRYDLDDLLSLKGVDGDTGNRCTGFRFRHYWFPATTLTYQQESVIHFSDGTRHQLRLEIQKQLVSCQSDSCLWRERIISCSENAKNIFPEREYLLHYDYFRQTLLCKRVQDKSNLQSDDLEKGRQQAVYGLPFVIPCGTVPLGFSWFTSVKDDYMNYRLESEINHNGMTILEVRREGVYSVKVPQSEQDDSFVMVKTYRKGITLYTPNRSVVLEDRIFDTTLEMSKITNTVNFTINRLIRSE